MLLRWLRHHMRGRAHMMAHLRVRRKAERVPLPRGVDSWRIDVSGKWQS